MSRHEAALDAAEAALEPDEVTGTLVRAALDAGVPLPESLVRRAEDAYVRQALADETDPALRERWQALLDQRPIVVVLEPRRIAGGPEPGEGARPVNT